MWPTGGAGIAILSAAMNTSEKTKDSLAAESGEFREKVCRVGQKVLLPERGQGTTQRAAKPDGVPAL
jgi:hypothetical protein